MRAPIFALALARGKPRCEHRPIDRQSLLLSALAVPTAALVVLGVTQARADPDLAPGGGGDAALGVQLAAGLALAAAAVHTARRRELVLSGALLAAAAGLALHALPALPDGAVLFTLALLGAGIAPAAAAHAALLHPGGRGAGLDAFDRAAVAAGYAVHLLLLGLLPALVFDPRATGCFVCPDNLLLVRGDLATAEWLATWGPRAAAAAEVALAALVLVRLVRRPSAARVLAAPVSAAAVAALALSAVAYVRAARGLGAEATDRDLWLATAAALGLMAAGLAWRPIRAARVRRALGRLTVAPPASADDIRATLSRAVGDPSLTVVLPHPETGTPIGADGRPAPASAPPGHVRTAVERRGRVVAWLEHRATVPAAPELPRTAALMLEREALRVAQRLQQEELRASTVRLVAAGEAERRRLERDLHDGAQQRLLALGLGLARARASADPADADALAEAARRVAVLSDELRSVAHGIHSVTLAEGGLGEAVLALVDASEGQVAVDALPEGRASAEAEAAVYRLVAAGVRLAGAAGARLSLRTHDGELEAVIEVPGAAPAALADALAHAGARAAALGGSVTVDGAIVRARVPAASG